MTGACRLIFPGRGGLVASPGARLGQERVRTGTLKACGGPSPSLLTPSPQPRGDEEEPGLPVGRVCEGRPPCPDQASGAWGGAFNFQPAISCKS